MEFVYENQGHITYLSYAISPEDIIDTMSLGMITNNKIPGLAPSVFTQMDATKYIKYNISAKISVSQFFSGTVTKKHLLGVFTGIVSAVSACEDYMIDINSVVLDLNYIFADVSTCDVSLICLPLQRDDSYSVNLNYFFKNIMFSTQFDQSENCDYVAKIINFLNTSAVFSLHDFKVLLDSLSSNSNGSAMHDVSVAKSESIQSNVYMQSPVETTQTVQNVQSIPTASPVQNASVVQNPQTVRQNVVVSAAVQQPAVPSSVKPSEQAASNSSKVTIPTMTPQTSVGKIDQQGKTTVAVEKKKGGFFSSLFSSNEKKSSKLEKNGLMSQSKPIPQAASSNFAIPGQKVPVNSPVMAKEPPIQKAQAPSTVKQAQGTPISNTAPTAAPNANAQFTMPQSQPMNFGETTVLGGGNIGETTVLGAAPTAAQPKPHLIRIKNNEKINLDKPVFRVGKEKSYVDYFIGDNTAISRSHANFITRDGKYFVVDTNSTNHTYVNGAMIQSNVETELSHGDKVRLSNEDFEFKLY